MQSIKKTILQNEDFRLKQSNVMFFLLFGEYKEGWWIQRERERERVCALNYIATTRCRATSFKTKDQTQTNIKKSTIIFVPDGGWRKQKKEFSNFYRPLLFIFSGVSNTRPADFMWSTECVCKARQLTKWIISNKNSSYSKH